MFMGGPASDGQTVCSCRMRGATGRNAAAGTAARLSECRVITVTSQKQCIFMSYVMYKTYHCRVPLEELQLRVPNDSSLAAAAALSDDIQI